MPASYELSDNLAYWFKRRDQKSAELIRRRTENRTGIFVSADRR